MDITKLYTRGGSVMAAQLMDNGESYPVLIEALGNEVILPELISSGWELTALPLELSKNGVALMALPKTEWTAELERQYGQDMYDMLGDPMAMEDRRKLVSNNVTGGSFKIEASYRINTREEFLEYLDSIADSIPDTDFMPLNYFVHPNARFSLQEYIKGAKYTSIINRRRRFSYSRYKLLCEFLKKHGMPEQFDSTDFLRAYMQWGVDGIQFSFKGRPDVHQIRSMFDTKSVWSSATNMLEPTEIYTYTMDTVFAICVRTETGMKVIPPKGYTEEQLFDAEHIPEYDFEIPNPRTHFHLSMDEDARLRILKPGEAIVVRRKVVRPRMQWECACDHAIGQIVCSFQEFKFGNALIAPGISISTPAGTPLPVIHIGNQDEIRNSGFAMVLGQMIADKRKTNTNASLYKALRQNGYSDYSALMYFITSNGLYDAEHPATIGGGAEGEEYFPVLRSNMVDVYLQARKDPERYDEIIETMPVIPMGDADRAETISVVADTLGSVLDGATNNFLLDEAAKEESTINAMMYYHSIRAVTMCTDVTVDDIYTQLKQWTPGNPVVLEFPGGRIIMEGSKSDAVKRAYDTQMQILRYEQVNNAPFFVWVDGIIKEFGDRSNSKHIGFFGSVLEAGKPRALEALGEMAKIYTDAVMEDLEPLRMTDPIRYERMAFTFLHVPGHRTLAPGLLDNTSSARAARSEGVAQFFAAVMLMQAIKYGYFRFNTPKRKNELHYIDEYPGLPDIVAKAKKCLVLDGKLLYTDCKSFADHIIDDQPFKTAQFFYTVNAVIAEDTVHPRINCSIPVYDPVCCYNFSTFEEIYKTRNMMDRLPGPVDKVFYRKTEIRGDFGERDLLWATLHRTSLTSNLRDYYEKVLATATEWKDSGSSTRLAGFSGTWDYPNVEPIDSFEPETDFSGKPCFKPGGWDSYRVEYVPDSVVVNKVERDIKLFTGVTCDEYAAGVCEFIPPVQAGHRGFLYLQGDSVCASIYGESRDAVRELNAADVATLDQSVFPVKHVYGSRYVFRAIDNQLYYVEV